MFFTRCFSVGEQRAFPSFFTKRCSPVIRPSFYDGQIKDKLIALLTRCLGVGEERALFEAFFDRYSPVFKSLVNNDMGLEAIRSYSKYRE